MYLETDDSLLLDLGEQALGSDQILSAEDLFKFVDCVNTSDVSDVSVLLLLIQSSFNCLCKIRQVSSGKSMH